MTDTEAINKNQRAIAPGGRPDAQVVCVGQERDDKWHGAAASKIAAPVRLHDHRKSIPVCQMSRRALKGASVEGSDIESGRCPLCQIDPATRRL